MFANKRGAYETFIKSSISSASIGISSIRSMFFSAPGREQTLSELREAGFGDLRTVMADDPLGSSTEFVFATRG